MDEISKKLEEAYNTLTENGKNTISGIIDWLRNATIVQDEGAEATAKEMLGEEKEITVERFKDAVKRIAEEKSATVEEYYRKLVDAASSVASKTGDKAQELLADAKEVAEQEAEPFKEAVARFKNETSNLVSAGTSSLNQTVNEQKTKVVDAAKNVFSIFSSSDK